MASIDLAFIPDSTSVLDLLTRTDDIIDGTSIQEFLTHQVDPYLRERADKRFTSEGDDVTGKWRPLRAATLVFRRKQGYGSGPINVRSGELKRYITDKDGKAVSHSLGATLTWPIGGGKDLEEKLRVAQSGDQPSRTVPRPVIGVNERDLGAVMLMLSTHIETQLTAGRIP